MKLATTLLTACIIFSNTVLAHNNEHPHPKMKGDIQKLEKRNHRLNNRIKKLEQELTTLRGEIETIKNTTPVVSTTTVYSCLLITQRKGSYFAKGGSRTEAKAKAIGKCEKANIKRYCYDDARYECDSEEM